MKLMSIADVALALGVTRQTVHNWLKSGTCPVAPIEGTKPRRWRVADVQALVIANDPTRDGAQ